MKHTANIITGLRIVLSFSLLFLLDNRPVFIAVFAVCGLSDFLDGWIARRTNTASAFGARLDSAADLALFLVIAASVAVWAGAQIVVWLPYVLAVAMIRFINMAVAAVKYHKFAVIHTWGNKITGILALIAFALFAATGLLATMIPVCIVAALSALEETAILLTSRELDPDRKSIFIRR